jgi:hypothetical protein
MLSVLLQVDKSIRFWLFCLDLAIIYLIWNSIDLMTKHRDSILAVANVNNAAGVEAPATGMGLGLLQYEFVAWGLRFYLLAVIFVCYRLFNDFKARETNMGYYGALTFKPNDIGPVRTPGFLG